MDILVELKRKHLSFEDYLSYSKTLTKRSKKERLKGNTHVVSLLLIEKNCALALMHQQRHLKLKKLKKAYKIGSSMVLNTVESIYFTAISGIYHTYCKQYEKAFKQLNTACTFFESHFYLQLNDSLHEFFTQWIELCKISLKQVKYQIQLQNLSVPDKLEDVTFKLDAGQSILKFGSKSFLCSSFVPFSLYEITEVELNPTIDYKEGLKEAIKYRDALVHNSFEKQFAVCWILFAKIALDFKNSSNKSPFEVGKCLDRSLKRLLLVENDCRDLLAENLEFVSYISKLKEILQNSFENCVERRLDDLKCHSIAPFKGLPHFEPLRCGSDASKCLKLTVFVYSCRDMVH